MIPEDWDIMPLEGIATVERGKFSVRPRNDPRYYGGLTPFIQTGDIASSGGYLKYYTQTLNKEGVSVSKLFPSGTILITIAANIGDIALTQFEVAVPDSIVAIIPKNGTDTKWLFQYLFTQKEVLDKSATQNAQKNINLQVLRPLKILVPPLREQRKIADILSNWDKAIALLEQLITAKRKLKQGLMQQLLTRKKRFKEFEGSEWAEKELGEVTIITRLAGAEYSSVWKEDENGEIIALRGFNIGKNRIIEKNLARISNELSLKLNRSRLYIGDVVYPCVGTIRNAAVIEENDKYHIQQNIAKITPIQTIISSYYLAYYLMSPVGLNEVLRFNASSSQPNVLVGSLRKYRIPLPPLGEQQKIASILSAADAEISTLEKQLAAYKQQKRGLMQQLLTGKKRVKIDEPQIQKV